MDDLGRLHRSARVLAGLSLVTVLGVAVAAGVVQAGEDGEGGTGPADPTSTPDPTPGFDYTSWRLVTGVATQGGAASYRVPGGLSWTSRGAADPVSYRDRDGEAYASGHALSIWRSGGCQVPGAWVLLGDPVPGSDTAQVARRRVQAWARGYAGSVRPRAPVSTPSVTDVELVDGVDATVAQVAVDLTGRQNRCVGPRGELAVVAAATDGGVKTLVAARYVGVRGALSTAHYRAILGSFDPMP